MTTRVTPMNAELLLWLQESTLAGSAATLLVLALRGPWRLALGARSLPWLWLLVPVAIIAVSLPAPAQPTALTGLGVLQAIEVRADGGQGDSAFRFAAILPWLWLSGALLLALKLVRDQQRFRRALGRLRPGPDGCWIAERSGVGPAVIGWLAPRIVLPADFAERYSPQQQALVLAHERCHLRHGDLHISLLASALRCLYWFNPLLQIAFRALRFDLELACDAATLANHPGSRRSYADAMLNTQLADLGLPVGCYWQSSHPLKKRIAMLNKPTAGRSRLLLSAAVALCLTAATGMAAWAAQGGASTADADRPATTRLSDSSYRSLKPPKYPSEALEAKVSGKVLLRVLVGVDGLPAQIEVEHSEPAGVFDQASIDAVRSWTFNPGSKDGQPVEGWVQVPITFNFDRDPDDAASDLPDSALDAIHINAGNG
jgi:TonB family protein